MTDPDLAPDATERDAIGSATTAWLGAPRGHALTAAELSRLGQTAESRALARDLKARGWRFVGPTTAYAFMQSMGLVNDHLPGCDTRAAVTCARQRFARP